jgi:hypothetical protein
MLHIYSCDAIKDELIQLYSKDFEITDEKKFLGMQVVDQIRYRLGGIATGSVLCISRIFTLASTSPAHGIPGRTPSFKITYCRSKGFSNLLSGYADADGGNSCSP